ncbi:MAG: DUF1217 domain-containing protein [Rhodospirillaceae bacterium]|nr:DUF1217 domain-containing protein [Rhodospirillaceae bacterium]
MLNASAALAILGGGGGGFGAGPTISSLAAFKNYQKDQVKAREAFMDQQTVQNEIDYFKRNAPKLNTIEDLLDNQRVLRFVLSSFGLEGDADKPGKIKAILKSDPDDVNSYANRLNDKRFGEFAKFMNATKLGATNLHISSNQNELTDKYLANEFEKDMGRKSPYLRDAIFFLREVNKATSTYDVLGSLPMRAIVTQTIGLPQEIARQSLEKQISLIEAKFDITKASLNSEDTPRTSLDVLTDDISALATARKQVTGAVNVLSSLESQLTSLRTTLQDVPNVTNTSGAYAAEIPIQEAAIESLLQQKGLIAKADSAVTELDTIVNRLDEITAAARTAEDADALTALQNEFTSLVSQVTGNTGIVNSASFTDPNDGNSYNLLRSGGDGGAGITAIAGDSITTTVKDDGTAVVTKGVDLANFLTELQNADTNFQAANFATITTDIVAVETNLGTAGTDFSAAKVQNGVNSAGIDGTVAPIVFAHQINSTIIANGQSAVDDGIKRANRTLELLADIRQLSEDALDPAADLVAINDSYSNIVSLLTAEINTPGSVTDGTTTVTYDNLLTGGATDYIVQSTNPPPADVLIRANGGALDTDILAALPGTITAGNAQTLYDDIDNTYTPAGETLRDQLTADKAVFDLAANKLDPYGSVDSQVRTIQDGLDGLLAGAARDDRNLLSEHEQDILLQLDSISTLLTISAETGFKSSFTTALESLEFQVANGGSQSEREQVLNDALFAASSALSSLRGEDYALAIQEEILNSRKVELEGDTSDSAFLKPTQNTEFAIQFIEQYLIKKDAEAFGTSFGAPNNSYLIGLIQPIAPVAGSGLNILG